MKTSKNLTGQLTLDELISSAEASHANHLAQQESGEGHPTIDIYGRKCSALFDKLAPRMSWQRTFAASLVGMKGWYSTRCALTWKVKATKSFRSYFQLQASTRRTAETEFGLWLPTPVAWDGNGGGARKPKDGKANALGYSLTLKDRAKAGMLPTPMAQDGKNSTLPKSQAKRQGLVGEALRGMLPTPTARCANNGTAKERPQNQPSRRSELNHLIAQEMNNGMLPTPSAGDGHKTTSNTHQKSINRLAPVGSGFQLSPHFVAEMMGFPQDWTVSPFQSGDESQ